MYNPGIDIDLPTTSWVEDTTTVIGNIYIVRYRDSGGSNIGEVIKFSQLGEPTKYYGILYDKVFVGEFASFALADVGLKLEYAKRQLWTLVSTDSYMVREVINVEDFMDGSSPPGALTITTSGNGAVKTRDFGGALGATVNDVLFTWEVPPHIRTTDSIRYLVNCVATQDDATATAKGVVFNLYGYSVGNDDTLNGAYGVAGASTSSSIDIVRFDRIKTNLSAAVQIPNLTGGELVMFKLLRNTGAFADNYLRAIGVSSIEIYYSTE